MPCCSTLYEPSWCESQIFWKSVGLISPLLCEQFSYLYKNSFCTVLLEERGFDIWLFCKATRLLLSSCARVAKLSVTCVFFFFIDWDKIFPLSWFSLWIWICQFFFFLIKVLFQWLGELCLWLFVLYKLTECRGCVIDSRWVITSCCCYFSCIGNCCIGRY